MRRIIIDTQSNRHFRGVVLEQRYDQRGGVCQAGTGDLVVTTDPIDPDFLRYWKDLGFDLPEFLVAGPFDPECTLSQLVLRNPALQRQIRSHVDGEPARLEFFCIEESEQLVSQALGITPYCNFGISIPLSRKPNFKRFFNQIGLRTPAWFSCRSREDLIRHGASLLDAGVTFLLKAEDGTGGIACGGMRYIANAEQLHAVANKELCFGTEFVVEEIVPRSAEISLHWEITVDGTVRPIGIFGQLSKNFGYAGAVWPAEGITDKTRSYIMKEAESQFWPVLLAHGAVGFFCCDIIVDREGLPYWIDFNPRKGAILYVHDMVRRLSLAHAGGKDGYFRHEHLRLPRRNTPYQFSEMRALLGDLLKPHFSGFAVVSNPGVIAHGYCDITGVSWVSAESAEARFNKARRRVLREG